MVTNQKELVYNEQYEHVIDRNVLKVKAIFNSKKKISSRNARQIKIEHKTYLEVSIFGADVSG
jgi:hypothetical protein